MFYLSLPLIFLRFWFVESPKNLLAFFVSFNNAFMQLFSLPLLVKTFFLPWKNEYRKGLIGFSIAMGMFVKTFVIIVDIFLLLVILMFEAIFMASFIFWPIGIILLLTI